MTTNIDRAAEVISLVLADDADAPDLPAPVAQTFPVGEFIDDERRARGWSYADLAKALGIPVRGVHELIDGRGRVTANIAERLGRAFGTSAQYWSIMQKTHDKEGK